MWLRLNTPDKLSVVVERDLFPIGEAGVGGIEAVMGRLIVIGPVILVNAQVDAAAVAARWQAARVLGEAEFKVAIAEGGGGVGTTEGSIVAG